jgi:protein-S-isoprenylcysteine O-methyltransferase Ste14
MLRGQPEQLEALDRQTDAELVTRWAWRAAIVGALGCFVLAPVLLGIFGHFLPVLIYKLFWALTVAGMGCVCLMFAAAAWLTFQPPTEG